MNLSLYQKTHTLLSNGIYFSDIQNLMWYATWTKERQKTYNCLRKHTKEHLKKQHSYNKNT